MKQTFDRAAIEYAFYSAKAQRGAYLRNKFARVTRRVQLTGLSGIAIVVLALVGGRGILY
jgi:hypothetical protein